jgi:thioredoxin-related protein
MTLRIFLLAAALALIPPSPAAQPAWRTWDAGLAAAKSSGKPVLVDVYTDWCGWCKRMDKDVYSRSDVREILDRHFVSVKLNAESSSLAAYQGRSKSFRSLASGFGVSGYPTTVFLKSNGEHLVNVPGYVPADRFKLMLRYIGEGHLDRGVSWTTFQQQAGAPRAK